MSRRKKTVANATTGMSKKRTCDRRDGTWNVYKNMYAALLLRLNVIMQYGGHLGAEHKLSMDITQKVL